MRRLIPVIIALVLLFGIRTPLIHAQSPNPLLPVPNSAILSPSGITWPGWAQSYALAPLPPAVLPLPFFPSQPYAGTLLCPSDVITEAALLFCGALAIAPPGAGTTPTVPTTTSGTTITSTLVPPVGCMSFSGGPCVTLCADGQWSSSTGPGTCSFHGGEASTTTSTSTPALFIPSAGCVSFTGGPCVTLCADGQWSSSTGPGTCSSHGGEATLSTTTNLVTVPTPTTCVSITGGPCVTLCKDGMWSSSTGPGTCSGHGGEA
jgi:hypothetical protein